MRLISSSKKESLELKKHVGLIHSVNKLSLLERKIANALLFNAYEMLLTKTEHQIHISDLANLIGYDSNDHKVLKKSLMSLISTVMEWNILDKDLKGKEVWVASSMLADAKIDGPICTYSYSKRMCELCHHPEFYARLNLKELSEFKSAYGIALYENCVRYKNIPQTPWFDLSLFKKLMGVEKGKYETFRDLNKRVISPAVKEVNTYSSIQVKPEYEKSGRVVNRIKFLIDHGPEKNQKEIAQLNNSENTLSNRLTSHYGFSAIGAKQLLGEYRESYLLEKMSVIESSASYAAGKIENLAKYLEKALKENFQAPKSSKIAINQAAESIKKNKLEQQVIEQRKEEYSAYQRQTVLDAYQKMCEKEKKEIDKQFEKVIKETAYYRAYITRGGIQDPLVCDRFVDFIKSNRSDILKCILSFNDFCKR